VVGGEFPEPVEMHNDHHTYYGCEGIDLAGLPVITGTMLPTTALQWPVSSKTDYSAHAKSDDNSYTTAAPSKSKRAARSFLLDPGVDTLRWCDRKQLGIYGNKDVLHGLRQPANVCMTLSCLELVREYVVRDRAGPVIYSLNCVEMGRRYTSLPCASLVY
jgi:hypothetical protein